MSKVYLIHGDAGTGKSTFSIPAEGKKWYAEWDPGSWERTGLDADELNVTVAPYRVPLTNLLDAGKVSVGSQGGVAPANLHKLQGWREEFWRFVNDYLAALKSGEYSLAIIDTATKLWLATRQGFSQEVQEAAGADKGRLDQLHYTEPNARMSQIIEAAKATNVNLVLIAHEKEIFSGDKGTGRYTQDSFKEIPNLADVTLRFTLNERKPVATVMKAGVGGLELIGMEIESPTMDGVGKLIDSAARLRREGIAFGDWTPEVIVSSAERLK